MKTEYQQFAKIIFLFFYAGLIANIESYGQSGTFPNITRGADTSEIYLTTFWYTDNTGSWGGIFRSNDNGKTLVLKHKYNFSLNKNYIYGDSSSGIIYLQHYADGDTLLVSHDYGVTYAQKPTADNGYGNFVSGCIAGEFYIGNMSLAQHNIKRFTEYGDSVQLMNTANDSMLLMDVGTLPGELYAMKWPYLIDTIGIAYSHDSGQNFSVFYQDTSIIANIHKYTWSRGVQPGELYMAGNNFTNIAWHIFHSTDYGHTLSLKYITEPWWFSPPDYISFTAGRTPGSFYILRVITYVEYNAQLWIYYSSDYGETYTTYFHDLDSTLTGINQSNGPRKIFLRPNPASGKVTLDFEDHPEQVDIKIIDLFGRSCLEKRIHLKVESPVIDVSALPEGIYFIQCRTSKHLYRVEELEVQRP